MAMPPNAVAMHEASLDQARLWASSTDPKVAALGRASRDISLALLRWHEGEKAAGTPAEVLATALNVVLGHAVAGFVTDHGGQGNLRWHLDEIEKAARSAIEEG